MTSRDMKFAFVAFIAILALVPTSAAFGVGGTIFDDEISPGQELVHKITVLSRQNEKPVNITAEVYGFSRSLGGVNIELFPEEDTGPYTARPFLSVEPKSFTLEPGEQETLLLKGTVPKDIGSGGKYALVTIKAAPVGVGQVTVSTAIQVSVLLTIKDSDLVMTGKISDLTTSMTDGNVSIDLLFENTGNVHYKTVIGAVLRDEGGEIVAEQGPTEVVSAILPANLRLMPMILIPEVPLVPGIYTVEVSVSLEDRTILDSVVESFEV